MSYSFKRGMIFCSVILLLSSCAKDFINPYDPATPADIWMPSELTIDTLGRNALRLSWQQDELHIDGYTVRRDVSGQISEFTIPFDSLTFNDIMVVDSSVTDTCPAVLYSVMARAGENRSFETFSYVVQLPFISKPNAGVDIIAEEASVTLAANQPAADETGLWSVVSGIGGTIANPNSPVSGFTGLSAENYVLSWSISKCSQSSQDDLSIQMPVIDIDGNSYGTVAIGTQIWMAENLRTTSVIHSTYESDEQYINPYGRLYSWDVVDQDNLCPLGWHVPSQPEWAILLDYLGGSDLAGGKMKIIGDYYWTSPNTGATNESGFSGVPGGMATGNGASFTAIGSYGYYWSSSENNEDDAWSRRLNFNNGEATLISSDKNRRYSVRCVKDQ